MKKLFAVILALAMTFALCATALAAPSEEEPSASPTPAPPTKGTITIQNPVEGTTYKAFRIFDVTLDAADPTTFSYTIKGGNGGSIWYTAVNNYAAMPTDPNETDANADGLTLTAIPGATNPTVYLVEVTDAFNAVDFAASMKTALTNMSNPTPDAYRGPVAAADVGSPYQLTTNGQEPGETNDNGQVDLGYYLAATYISEPEGEDPVLTGLVSLDTTSPDAEIIDKNAPTPGFGDETDKSMGKRVKDNTDNTWDATSEAELGETINFRIRMHLPKYDGSNEVDTYTIIDKIESGFAYINDSLTVKAYPDSNFTTDAAIDLYPDHSAVTGAVITQPAAEGWQMSVALTPGSIVGYPADAYVEITYQVKVDTDAVYDNINTAVLTWTCKAPEGSQTAPDPSYHNAYPNGLTGTTHTYVVGYIIIKQLRNSNLPSTSGEIKPTKIPNEPSTDDHPEIPIASDAGPSNEIIIVGPDESGEPIIPEPITGEPGEPITGEPGEPIILEPITGEPGEPIILEPGEPIILPGSAKFKLYRDETGGNAIGLVKLDSVPAGFTSQDLPPSLEPRYADMVVYRLAVTGDVNIVYEFTAGNTGIFGLDADRDYWLEETEAPPGYNPLPARIRIELPDPNSQPVRDTTSPSDLEGYWHCGYLDTGKIGKYEGWVLWYPESTIINEAGAELPSVGGIGTTVFHIVGGLFIAAAAVLLTVRRKTPVQE